MDLRKVKKLIELLEASSLDEIEIKEGEETVRISRHPAPAQAVHAVAAAPSPAPAAAHAAPLGPAPRTDEPAVDDANTVKSPMVGTFYKSASPGSPAFASVGQSVKVGDPLCIIEAMKLMNRIECETAGVIAAVLAEDGQPVEFGQPLFAIDPA